MAGFVNNFYVRGFVWNLVRRDVFLTAGSGYAEASIARRQRIIFKRDDKWRRDARARIGTEDSAEAGCNSVGASSLV